MPHYARLGGRGGARRQLIALALVAECFSDAINFETDVAIHDIDGRSVDSDTSSFCARWRMKSGPIVQFKPGMELHNRARACTIGGRSCTKTSLQTIAFLAVRQRSAGTRGKTKLRKRMG